MKQQFLQIILKDSEQEVSCFTLENMVGLLRDPDFRQQCQLCKQDFELTEIFPLVGFAISIKKIKINKETQIKVTQFFKVEKTIDTYYLQQKHFITKEGQPNCILPLLSSKEGNDQLLNCDLFNRKISYLVHQKLDSYKENTYLLLIQASIYHLIKKNGNQSWGKEILMLAFETCKQVFINTSLFCNSILAQNFQASKFQLLNLFCLFYMEQIRTEEIFDNYIRPNFQSIYELNEDQVQSFFNALKFESVDQIYQNIQLFMDDYLKENNYFILKFSQKRFLQSLIEYMIPKKEQWMNLQKLESIQNKWSKIILLKHYTISSIYQKLLDNLFEEYSEEKKLKYFDSFSKHFEEDEQSYQQFLMLHNEYYEIYEIYELYNQTQNGFQSYNSILLEKYQTITISFIVNKISLDSIKRKNPQSILDLSTFDELNKINTYLNIFKKIFNLNEQFAQTIHCSIFEEIKNLTWLNFLSSITNFQQQDQIKLFLKKFLTHLKIWKSIQVQDACARNLIDLSRFSFLLMQRSRMLHKNHFPSQQEIQDIIIKNRQKEQFCQRIYGISRILEQ